MIPLVLLIEFSGWTNLDPSHNMNPVENLLNHSQLEFSQIAARQQCSKGKTTFLSRPILPGDSII